MPVPAVASCNRGHRQLGRLRARARAERERARVPALKTEDESSSLQVQPACAAHSVCDTRHATARSVPRFGLGRARAGARGACHVPYTCLCMTSVSGHRRVYEQHDTPSHSLKPHISRCSHTDRYCLFNKIILYLLSHVSELYCRSWPPHAWPHSVRTVGTHTHTPTQGNTWRLYLEPIISFSRRLVFRHRV